MVILNPWSGCTVSTSWSTIMYSASRSQRQTVVLLHAFLFLKTEILRNQEHKQICPPLQRHNHSRVTKAAMEGEGELPWLPACASLQLP